MMTFTKAIGIFGGTFDPIHFGHLRTALELYQQLPLREIRFLPCQQPVHKAQAAASSAQRVAMLQLAIAEQEGFSLDRRELARDTPSYMYYTLCSLRAELGATPLCLICSMDTFLDFTNWHRWQEILELAHLVVAVRPPYIRPSQLHESLLARLTTDPNALATKNAGSLFFATTTPLSLASSTIRQSCKTGLSARYLVPDPVAAYIRQQGLYQD
jgi:nicotinate-nucleotide adenylyltransferase